MMDETEVPCLLGCAWERAGRLLASLGHWLERGFRVKIIQYHGGVDVVLEWRSGDQAICVTVPSSLKGPISFQGRLKDDRRESVLFRGTLPFSPWGGVTEPETAMVGAQVQALFQWLEAGRIIAGGDHGNT